MEVEYPDWITTYVGAIQGLLLVCGLFMLRKSKRAEIKALWDHRWSRDVDTGGGCDIDVAEEA